MLSAWSGIRPLALDPNAKDTASASRDHIVTTDDDGLITVCGEKDKQPRGCLRCNIPSRLCVNTYYHRGFTGVDCPFYCLLLQSVLAPAQAANGRHTA